MRWRRSADPLTPLGSRSEPSASAAPSDESRSEADETALIDAWRREQTAFWRVAAPPYAEVEAELLRLNQESPTLYVFEFSPQGDVAILNKPHAGRAELEPDVVEIRAQAYLRFFQYVARRRHPRADGLLGMEMEDRAPASHSAPLFAFQKPCGDRSILMVDIDAIVLDFYEGEERDAKSYEDKATRAIFAGSTTGSAHTAASVAALTDDRLRAGVFFREDERVDFRLPSIVQCLDTEAEGLMRELGFGVGRASWREQLGCKFLLSLDGNGAACSRVARSLRSNSVLLKYKSPHLLYYFSGLQPWLHYIPIEDFGEVGRIVQVELEHPGYFAEVARQGRMFADRWLGRLSSSIYAAGVIEDYFSAIGR